MCGTPLVLITAEQEDPVPDPDPVATLPPPFSRRSLSFLATDKRSMAANQSRRREEKCPRPSRPHTTINPNPWRPVGGRDGAGAGSIAGEEVSRVSRRRRSDRVLTSTVPQDR